ncbi:MAG: hypothetical protein IPP71_11565 [Bacteroidetes bacterium]|nr:hypothetical protein [Bacteroidota bacterium]
MLSTTATIQFKYVDDNSTPNPLPGLFGLDMMAFHTNNNSGATYWSQLHASDWRYQPLIVVPKASTVSPNYIESQLVFHIKDSYQEFNKLTSGSTTGMKKQVRLNDNILWEEDIADGGDDWERIAIPYAVLHPFLNSNQSNTLSFHIASDAGATIPNTLVRGLIVWIDDIYLNKFDDAMGTNLITDGSVECADGYGDCDWVIADIYDSGCTPPAIAPPGSDEDFSYYPDGSRVTTSAGLSSKGDFSKTDRKSGQFALQLVLPFCLQPVAPAECLLIPINQLILMVNLSP